MRRKCMPFLFIRSGREVAFHTEWIDAYRSGNLSHCCIQLGRVLDRERSAVVVGFKLPGDICAVDFPCGFGILSFCGLAGPTDVIVCLGQSAFGVAVVAGNRAVNLPFAGHGRAVSREGRSSAAHQNCR